MGEKEQKLLRDFIEERYSKNEYLRVLEHFQDDEKFESLKDDLEKHWNKTDGSELSDETYQKLWSKIKPEIWKQKSEDEHRWKHRFVQTLQRVAAILVIPLIITSVYFFIEWQSLDKNQLVYAEIYSPPGMRSRFNLPDGSTGWLNNNSRLKYPIQFSNNRSVELVGEAYFEVKKDKHSPFVVNTQGIEIKVLGTHFNVMAYQDVDRLEVTLEEGSVNVTKKGTDLNETLKPSEHLVHYKANNIITVTSVETSYFTSWKDGFLEFRNVPLSEVAARLGKWYNSDIIIQDDVLKNIQYRATFKDESLERILTLLTLTAPIKFEIIEPEINDDGFYEKQKVILRYKN